MITNNNQYTNVYDYAILGSGLAGLLLGAILSKNGFSVLILEKNSQLGGMLQIFSRDKRIFDTGIHYVGGMLKGQPILKMFDYLGITDQLKLKELDENGFDQIYFLDTNENFSLKKGWDKTLDSFIKDFPHEKENLLKFHKVLIEELNYFLPYFLIKPKVPVYPPIQGAYYKIKEYINDEKLVSLLGGNGLAYAARKDSTSFSLFSLFQDSFINGTVRFLQGSSQVAKVLSKIIHQYGGKIVKHEKVKNLKVEDLLVTQVETESGQKYFAKNYVSNIHPKLTFRMLDPNPYKRITRDRIENLEETPSIISFHFSIKPRKIKLFNHNKYIYDSHLDVWEPYRVERAEWPSSLFISCGQEKQNQTYVSALNVLAYGDINTWKKWENTYHTVQNNISRGEDYERLKVEKTEIIIKKLEIFWPKIRSYIINQYCSTPLTYRDYIGNINGSAYGIDKNYQSLAQNKIPPGTKIKNLFLTGQNINGHGFYGAAISSFITLCQMPGLDHIVHDLESMEK